MEVNQDLYLLIAETDLFELHWSFGETWKVDPILWLFRSPVADQIRWENEGLQIGTSVYNVTEDMESTYSSVRYF